MCQHKQTDFLVIVAIIAIAIALLSRPAKVESPVIQATNSQKLVVNKPIPVAFHELTPVIISKDNLKSITDEKLRLFVKQHADFETDQVLFFEWIGGEKDTLKGVETSDISTKNKKYLINLESSGGNDLSHRQVFIIPSAYTYEISNGNLE